SVEALAFRLADFQDDAGLFCRVEIGEATAIRPAATHEGRKSALFGNRLCLIQMIDGEADMKDAGALGLEEPALWGIAGARLAELQLQSRDIGIFEDQLAESVGVRH